MSFIAQTLISRLGTVSLVPEFCHDQPRWSFPSVSKIGPRINILAMGLPTAFGSMARR